MNTLIQELKSFSRQNWWVYLLLAIALIVVYVTGRGNMVEIIAMFLWNFSREPIYYGYAK